MLSGNTDHSKSASSPVPAYTPSPATPPPLNNQLPQSTPISTSANDSLSNPVPPGQNTGQLTSQEGSPPEALTNDLTREHARKPAPTVSPTATWTHPPGTQTAPAHELKTDNMAIDFEGIGKEDANLENEDIDMQSGSPKQLCTPDAKNPNNDGTPVSSQKDCRPALIPSKEVASSSKSYGNSLLPKEATSPADESQQKAELKHHACAPHSSARAPLSHNPAPPTELTDGHNGDNRSENTDPITFTPPRQRDCRSDANPVVSLASGQCDDALRMLKNTDQARDAAISLDNVKGKGKGKQSQKPAAAKHRDEPLIHAALKRSATASANDETQICIDITGENDEKDPDGTPETVSDAQEDQRKSHSQYATITPFLNASEKWFPALNADLQCIWCGSGPVLCWFAVFSAGETQIWPGDLRVVAVAVFLFVVLVFPWICLICEA